jgi:hypothetical protein
MGRASGQEASSSDPAHVISSCTFAVSAAACGYVEESAVPGRATLTQPGRDGNAAIRLHTEPGDGNVFGSGDNERDDITLTPEATQCSAGAEQWWAHSILFPSDFVLSGGWGQVVFDFHNTDPGPGQANFEIDVKPDGTIRFAGYGGVVPYPAWREPDYQAYVGPVVRNQWYDFVYHVRWSPNGDGFFYAWVNGALYLAYTGPTLYWGQSCYLKLANYHTPTGYASSVEHDRIVLGSTPAAVALTPLQYVDSMAAAPAAPAPVQLPAAAAPAPAPVQLSAAAPQPAAAPAAASNSTTSTYNFPGF